jgi:hypothetical protein
MSLNSLNIELIYRTTLSIIILVATTYPTYTQQSSLTLNGQVRDEFGASIVGATVIITKDGTEKTATTNGEGVYTISGLAPGQYTLRASATGFATFEDSSLNLVRNRQSFNITLKVTIAEENVTVGSEPPISTQPENNATALVLRGAELESLPDDADELAEALQALAGPSAGPSGGQIYIDGFTGGRLPPKETIREIRINSNPFSAEYDQLGMGRIEILTKPGMDQFRGQVFFNFGDESLNSRNPFAPNRPSYQEREYGGNLSGPIASKKASFFVDFEKDDEDDNSLINARVLDPSLNIVPFNLSLLTPERRTTFSPRLDYQLNANNTIVGRYTFNRISNEREGVNDFDLPSRAYNRTNTQHSLQLTETAIISPTVVSELRLQFVTEKRELDEDSSDPAISVLDAFTTGGAQVGLSSYTEDRWELQNNITWAHGNHSVKAGARLRAARIRDISARNFGGTLTFGGGTGPELVNNQVRCNPQDPSRPNIVPITSLERYRRTLLYYQGALISNPACAVNTITEFGAGPTQLSIAGGDPEAAVKQWDTGLFIQDDWRIRSNFTLSLGLRYENQNNISSNMNFAPRIGFSWSPTSNANQPPKIVIRGGFGIFYNRIAEDLTLQTNRYNGFNQQQFVINNPANLIAYDLSSGFIIPSVDTLTAFALPQTTRVFAEDIQAPYTIQSVVSVERQLPYNFTAYGAFVNSRILHLLRSRNINAPINGIRPLGNVGNVYQYESSGRFNQNQIFVGVNNRLSRRFSVSFRYSLNNAESDTDGAGTFPANQYDLSSEYGRSSFDTKHRVFLIGNVGMPWGIRLTPFMVASSGRPFNITIGRDINGDSLFTDRPAFATDLTKPGVVITKYGAFDPNPTPGQELIPRNYGTGPSFLNVNLRASKSFGFGNRGSNSTAPPQETEGQGRRGNRGGGSGGGGGGGSSAGRVFGGGGMRSFFSDDASDSRYNLTLSLQIQNILNRVNYASPVGNITSPLFGLSTSTARGFGQGGGGGGGGTSAGNRRVELQIRFSF